jgi:hypothetical protein
VITFALRLDVSGGRAAVARLLLAAAAGALGVGLLLSTLATVNAVHRSDRRQLWLDSGVRAFAGAPGADVLSWRAHADYYAGRKITWVDVAAAGPTVRLAIPSRS